MKETLLMIHGMWAGPWVWDGYRKIFEKAGYNCVTPVLRHHEMDPRAIPNYRLGTTSVTDYTRDIIEKVIFRLDGRPIIIGHSLGGLIAQILASCGMARAIVLLAPAPPAGIMALDLTAIWKGYWSILATWGFWKKPVKRTFSEVSWLVFNLLPKDEQKKLYDKFVYESGRALCEVGFWLFDRKKATKVYASKVNCPVLIIAGSQDRTTPISVVCQIADKYKNVTLQEFSNHAHWLVGESGFEEIAEYILYYLSQLPE